LDPKVQKKYKRAKVLHFLFPIHPNTPYVLDALRQLALMWISLELAVHVCWLWLRLPGSVRVTATAYAGAQWFVV
jgi:hypothetical protein